MNKFILSLLLIFSTFSSFALNEDAIETGFFNNKAIYGYDTVAYFTQNKAVEGKDNITTEWRGAVWHFANNEHKALFVADPEKYAPQYGGHCAFAMADGKFVGIDEDAFTIVNDKLYLNYSKSVHADWLNNQKSFIKQADIKYKENVELP